MFNQESIFAKLSQAPAPAGLSLALFPNYPATPTDPTEPTGLEYLFFANILTYTQCNLAKIKLSQVTFTLTYFSLFSY